MAWNWGLFVQPFQFELRAGVTPFFTWKSIVFGVILYAQFMFLVSWFYRYHKSAHWPVLKTYLTGFTLLFSFFQVVFAGGAIFGWIMLGRGGNLFCSGAEYSQISVMAYTLWLFYLSRYLRLLDALPLQMQMISVPMIHVLHRLLELILSYLLLQSNFIFFSWAVVIFASFFQGAEAVFELQGALKILRSNRRIASPDSALRTRWTERTYVEVQQTKAHAILYIGVAGIWLLFALFSVVSKCQECSLVGVACWVVSVLLALLFARQMWEDHRIVKEDERKKKDE